MIWKYISSYNYLHYSYYFHALSSKVVNYIVVFLYVMIYLFFCFCVPSSEVNHYPFYWESTVSSFTTQTEFRTNIKNLHCDKQRGRFLSTMCAAEEFWLIDFCLCVKTLLRNIEHFVQVQTVAPNTLQLQYALVMWHKGELHWQEAQVPSVSVVKLTNLGRLKQSWF